MVSGQHESSITMRMTTPKEVCMRGDDQEQQGAMWSYVPMERRIPADHPLRRLRPMVDGLLQELSPRFDELYSDRKSTRLNSSHDQISYAVFCLKKKKLTVHGMRSLYD